MGRPKAKGLLVTHCVLRLLYYVEYDFCRRTKYGLVAYVSYSYVLSVGSYVRTYYVGASGIYVRTYVRIEHIRIFHHGSRDLSTSAGGTGL